MTLNDQKMEHILSGTIVSGGIAEGRACLFINTDIHAPADLDVAMEPPKDGWSRIEDAIKEQLEKLEHRIQRGGFSADSSVFSLLETYRVFLRDPMLHASLQNDLQKNGDNATAAVRSTCRKLIRNFEHVSNGRAQPKAILIADLGKMLMESLGGSRSSLELNPPEKSILVTDHLFVSNIVALQKVRPSAIIVQHGHPASHGLILARELEIPILCEVHDAIRHIQPGTSLVVDADQSRIIIHPSHTMDAYRLPKASPPVASGPETKYSLEIDGTPVRVMADVGCVAASERAEEAGADGIGLLRMESLYMQSDRILLEEEIVQQLSDILAPMAAKPVYVRLLDIGGDKPLAYVKDSLGGSSMTGYRGVRLLAAHPELLQPQLQAFLKLSLRYKVHILVPMVTVAEDMRLVRDALEAASHVVGIAPPPLGAMIETPAAALMVDRLWEWCDFVRIGSNDLTQYTMAASRDNPLAEGYFQPTHPSVMKLIGKICRSEDAELIGLCGSLADRQDMVPQLLRLGVREFVVPPRSIGALRRAVVDHGESSGETLPLCNDEERIR
ncbi:MAG: hypothetical protein DRP64_01115 [Verrucomicrobia bacterium]|nr:MAG: hypothetical protein DRP64_01115 [Verrucomicrobiota bacterium]